MAGARLMERRASEKARSDRIHAVRERASTENFGQSPDESDVRLSSRHLFRFAEPFLSTR